MIGQTAAVICGRRRVLGGLRIVLGAMLLGWVTLTVSACTMQATSSPALPTEILWDTWGVPHIYAGDEEETFRAFGWAQMHSHGDLILRLYAQARGQGAEVYGHEYRAADEAVRLLGIPTRGAAWYAAQSPAFTRNIDAFVAGMNEYARQFPDRLSAGRSVLPVTGADTFRHMARLMALIVAANTECSGAIPGLDLELQESSTGWAFAPERTVGGHAMLLAAPSLPWQDVSTLYEAQLTAPGIDIYGAAFVGFPVLAFGFNRNLAWTHTLSPADACDLYRLTPAGVAPDTGYLVDGQIRAFDTITETLGVRQADGRLLFEPFVVRRAVQGPVLTRKGDMLAVRMAGQDQLPVAGVAEQWWAMGKAGSWEEFQAALEPRQLPRFNVLYADRTGKIAGLVAANVPARAQGGCRLLELAGARGSGGADLDCGPCGA